jgi:uncharacterized membrane protein
MFRRWGNTILYIVLMIAEITAYCVCSGNTLVALIVIIGIVQISRRFIPKIIAEFKGTEE